MKNLLIYEAIKLIIVFGACFLTFSIVPLSLYIIFVPLDLISWWLTRNRITTDTWIGLAALAYVASVIFSYAWIMTGHTGLEFLLDFDIIRSKLRGL